MKKNHTLRAQIVATLLISVLSVGVTAGEHVVSITAPGGHSFGAYGNTNAVHAAANAIREIAKTLPDVIVSDFTGGATVNAIATDARFRVVLPDDDKETLEALRTAVARGVKRENDFRGVKPGDLTKGGTPAEVRWKLD